MPARKPVADPAPPAAAPPRRWASAAIAARPAWIGGAGLRRAPRQRPGPQPVAHAAATADARPVPVDVTLVNPGTPLTEPPEISVVLAVRQDLQRLIAALGAWRTACAGRRTQVVVVDAGSADRTTSTILKDWREVTLLRTAGDLGPAWSLDIGLARCQGPILLLADPGARPTGLDVEALVGHLLEHPRCGVVAAGLADPDGAALPGSATPPTLRHLLIEESGWARLCPRWPAPRRLATLEEDASRGPRSRVPPAGLLALRREALDEVGPLDTNLPFHAHHLDWFLRLEKRGWQVHLRADLRVRFEAGARPDPDDAWRRHRDRLRYARKHHGPWGVRCATASLWSFAIVEAAARLLGRSEVRHRGLFGALEALTQARRTRESA